jgi:hypothetical protein
MRKRASGEEAPFGSDSFLDVLANMVGILIILIVITAIRLGRGPGPSGTAEATADEQPEPVAQAPAVVDPEPAPPIAVAEPEPESDDPPPEMRAEMNALARRESALEAKSQAARSRLAQLKAEYDASREKLAAEEKAAEKSAGALREGKLELARLEQALGERKETLTALLAEFEEAKNSRPPVAEIKHRLAPVSRQVAEELHFRVKGGRVSVVPWKILLERCEQQFNRQRDWLASRGNHESSVGPVDGFSLQFVVEKVALTGLRARRLGYGATLIRATEFTFIPEPDLVSESVEEALRRGSRFALAVQAAPDNAALTFWVYPDSFLAFRKLQAACHAEGFIVCGRPLPDGHPISASPQGTASAGQ